MVCKQTWTSPLATSKALKIVENVLERRKLLPPKVGGSRTQKSGPQNITKLVLENPKNSLYIVLLLIKFKDN